MVDVGGLVAGYDIEIEPAIMATGLRLPIFAKVSRVVSGDNHTGAVDDANFFGCVPLFWPEAVIVAFIKMKGYPWRPVAVQ
jgi:hypothetical protein